MHIHYDYIHISLTHKQTKDKYTQTCFQTLANYSKFTHRHFYTLVCIKCLHTNLCTQNDLQETHRHFYTHKTFVMENTEALLHIGVFTRKRFFTRMCLSRDVFTHTQTPLLHRSKPPAQENQSSFYLG